MKPWDWGWLLTSVPCDFYNYNSGQKPAQRQEATSEHQLGGSG